MFWSLNKSWLDISVGVRFYALILGFIRLRLLSSGYIMNSCCLDLLGSIESRFLLSKMLMKIFSMIFRFGIVTSLSQALTFNT